jgi:hypothetical protein
MLVSWITAVLLSIWGTAGLAACFHCDFALPQPDLSGK